jgi:DNA-binding transcriptional LysR family regulator
LFPDWSGEMFPLYALFPSRRHAAKVRTFVDFSLAVIAKEAV